MVTPAGSAWCASSASTRHGSRHLSRQRAGPSPDAASVEMTNPLPKSLFKYASASGVRAIIETLHLKWTSPLGFNDPFDSQLDFRAGYDEATLGPSLLARMKEWIASDAPLPATLNPGIAKALIQGRTLRSLYTPDQ